MKTFEKKNKLKIIIQGFYPSPASSAGEALALPIKGRELKAKTLKLLRVTFFAQTTAFTDPNCDKLLKQFTEGGGNVGASTVGGLPQICTAQGIILQAINIGLAFAGGIAVLFVMVGGYWYLTSAGNEEQAEKGKKTLINSIIGLVVIIMAVVIVRIVAQTLQAK